MKWILGLLVIGLIGWAIVFFSCPCERLPGGYLLGEVSESAIEDWSFVNNVERCALEVSGVLPHSVTLNCMASPDGRLFISCSQCAGKYWSGIALENPNGRIRIGEQVHPVVLHRLVDDASLDVAWLARIQKLGIEADRPDHWWSFQLQSR